jgi:hypothetical protein
MVEAMVGALFAAFGLRVYLTTRGVVLVESGPEP